MKKIQTIKEIENLCGKKVILRLDLNVPINKDIVREDYRIRKSLPTIDFLRHAGAKVVIISHIESEKQTLKPVFEYLKNNLKCQVDWCQDILESGKDMIDKMKDGDVLLSENIRLYDGEKKNDPVFSKKLASFFDVYVNDAFSVSHRSHASIVGIPKFLPHYVGLQMALEIEELSRVFSPEHPFLFILGGAKFDTKLPLIQKFINTADSIFVGGALSNNFFKEAGCEVGVSLVSDGFFDTKRFLDSGKVSIPDDVVVQTPDGVVMVDHTKVKKGQKIVDAGPETMTILKKQIDQAKFILWNGPLGGYEDGFTGPTLELARYIAEKTKQGARSIVGGGDTLAAIAKLGIEKDFSFVSTAGGAMLDFLSAETLPGIKALTN